LSHLWPTGSSSGLPPSTTARYFSAYLSDSTSRWTPCPPKSHERWLQVCLGCVGLSLSCPVRLLHTFLSLRPARRYSRLWIQRPSSRRRRGFNPPDQRTAQHTLRPHLTSAARSPISPPAYSDDLAQTWAVQTDLSRCPPNRGRVLLPLPRRDRPRLLLRTSPRPTWPSSPCARLGSRSVLVSRRQASLHVAARVLAFLPLEVSSPRLAPEISSERWGCATGGSASFPGRDFHPLVGCAFVTHHTAGAT